MQKCPVFSRFFPSLIGMIRAVQSRVEPFSDKETSDCDFDRSSPICHKGVFDHIKNN